MHIRICNSATEWNPHVLALDGTLYHSWQWGELRRFHGWIPWRVIAEEDGTSRAALQILERRIPVLGASILYAPRGIAHRDGSAVTELLDWLRSFLRERNTIFLRIDPDISEGAEDRKHLLTSLGFRSLSAKGSMWNLPRATMVLDISLPEAELFRRMRRTHRQLILRAGKDSIEWHTGTEEQDLKEFHNLLIKTSQRQGFPVRSLDYFLQLRSTVLSAENGLLLLARFRGKAIAGVLCARFGASCHYLYGGFDWDFRQVQVNEALQWQAIQWAKGLGCREYDMGGAGTSYPPREGNRGYGIYNYKRGLGAELRYSVGLLDLVGNKAAYRVFRIAEKYAFPRAHKLIGAAHSKIRRVAGSLLTSRRSGGIPEIGLVAKRTGWNK